MTNEQLRVATKNFMEMRFGSVKEAEDPDRWYERFGLIYDALTEVMPREYVPGEWIPIAERLPEHDQDCLISGEGCVSAATASLKFAGHKIWWHGCGFGGYEWEWDFTPTHWMPLPKPAISNPEEKT